MAEATHSREWSESAMQSLIAELAHAVDEWEHRNPEDTESTMRTYGRVLCIARSMQSHLANIGDHDYRTYARQR